MRHSDLVNLIIKSAPRGCILFKSQTGGVKVGSRFIKFGLVKGASDIIGIQSVNRVGVFVAIEVKIGKDVLRKEQAAFLAMVKRMGGLSGVARNMEDAADILQGKEKKEMTDA